jgi:3-dehydroquinate dehydratase-2
MPALQQDKGESVAKHVMVIHGCNLDLLGTREPEIYGRATLAEINRQVEALARELGLEVRIIQSNHEGEIIDAIHEAAGWAQGIIINPAGFTTTSVGIHDALKGVGLPAVEVHLSNIHAREEFRRHSLIAAAAIGQISGFGGVSYLLALRALAARFAAAQG